MCKEKSMELQFSWVWTEFPEQNSQLQGTSISFATLNFWKILEIMVFNSQVMSVLRLSDMCHECLRIVHKKLRQRGENLSLRQQPRSDPWQPHCSTCSCVFCHPRNNWKCACPCYILLLAVCLSCRSFAWPQRALQPLIPWLFALHVTCSTIIYHPCPFFVCVRVSRCVPWSRNPFPIYPEHFRLRVLTILGSGSAVLLWWWASILMRRWRLQWSTRLVAIGSWSPLNWNVIEGFIRF